MKTAGLLLIVVGAIMLVWTGFSFTKKEKVLDIGPLEVSADKKETVNWPPYIGAILVVGGIAVVAMSRRRA
ncbi:hypothetical protein [Siphonobacter curvatus]|uniref:DUF3185 domain-containing protein n=1 Tax=Siphonobacter curvatus TaxID=2094562 RepID=A0A2S7IKB1_9BACT|nr:hypothetical protein [Siphonobacter curvatus]PQA56926.1 hypothetical protein C5O19_16460 [Siphonobacter curvatus]